MVTKPGGRLLTIEANAEGVADSGNHRGYKGSSAHLAGELVVWKPERTEATNLVLSRIHRGS